MVVGLYRDGSGTWIMTESKAVTCVFERGRIDGMNIMMKMFSTMLGKLPGEVNKMSSGNVHDKKIVNASFNTLQITLNDEMKPMIDNLESNLKKKGCT